MDNSNNVGTSSGAFAVDISGLSDASIQAAAAEAASKPKRKSNKKATILDPVEEEKLRSSLNRRSKPLTYAQKNKSWASLLPGSEPIPPPPPQSKNGASENKQMENQQKQDVLIKIQKYYANFSHKLGGDMPKGVNKYSLEALEAHLATVQSRLNQSHGEKFTKGTFHVVCQLLEMGYMVFCYQQPWNPVSGANLSGFSHNVMRDVDYFKDELIEIQILYPGLFEHGLWVRLGHKLFEKASDTVKQNSDTSVSAPVPANVKHEFADL
jgi:hypothetical protein